MNTTFTKLTATLALLFAAGSLTAGEKSSLDGKWRFCYDDQNIGEQKEYYKKFPENAAAIVVPYAYETPASGIKDGDIHGIMWYQRTFKTARIGKEKK